MEANPLVCGIAMEFAPNVYSDVKSTYGFTPYVTQLTGEFERLDLGMFTNSYEWDWWVLPNETGNAGWVSPFRDTSIGHVIACYAIPVMYQGSVFAVIAVDIDTEAFSRKCDELSPYPGASTMILDRSFRFISHENSDYLLKSASELSEFGILNDDDSLKTAMESGSRQRVLAVIFMTISSGTKSSSSALVTCPAKAYPRLSIWPSPAHCSAMCRCIRTILPRL